MRFAGEALRSGLLGAISQKDERGAGGLLGAAGVYEPLRYDSRKGVLGSSNPVGGFVGGLFG